MTDDEVIANARRLCDRGDPIPGGPGPTPRLNKILSDEDAFLGRWVVPALLELIERRGLKDVP